MSTLKEDIEAMRKLRAYEWSGGGNTRTTVALDRVIAILAPLATLSDADIDALRDRQEKLARSADGDAAFALSIENYPQALFKRNEARAYRALAALLEEVRR